jgi:hypothetical protein
MTCSSEARTLSSTAGAATLEDVGNVAAFAASDRARIITATAINISGGSVVDQRSWRLS